MSRLVRWSGLAWLLAAFLGGAMASPMSAQAQNPKPAVVRVLVVDTNRAPLRSADVIVIRDRTQAILIGQTDSAGRYAFRIDVDNDRKYSIAARRLGYAPATAEIRLVPGDTLSIDIELEHTSATALPSVLVEGRKASHFFDSTEIAQSHRTIYDAFDAVRKLRPDMLSDPDRCPRQPTDNVWVNGRRVLFMASRAPVFGYRPATGYMTRVASRKMGPPALDSTLASIKAQHIAEIRWVDCNDTSLPGMGSNNAIYIVLKPGIGWDLKRGSYVDSVNAPSASKRARQQ